MILSFRNTFRWQWVDVLCIPESGCCCLFIPLFLHFSFSPISNIKTILSHFSQELCSLQNWNLVHTWTVGGCIVYTGIRMLLLIHPLFLHFSFSPILKHFQLFVFVLRQDCSGAIVRFSDSCSLHLGFYGLNKDQLKQHEIFVLRWILFYIPGGPKTVNNQTQRQAPPPKPFAPLGNRKALVEKSGLVKHATNKSKREKLKQQSDAKGTTNRWASSPENLFLVFDQIRLKPACSATETS